MKTLTIRNVSPKLSEALEKEKQRLGISLNGTVLHLLGESLNLETPSTSWTNGLEKLAGGWSDEDFQEFEKNTADQRTIDPEIWE